MMSPYVYLLSWRDKAFCDGLDQGSVKLTFTRHIAPNIHGPFVLEASLIGAVFCQGLVDVEAGHETFLGV